ncbi:hypothetical protein PG987_010352 [Apiospora arundinis]
MNDPRSPGSASVSNPSPYRQTPTSSLSAASGGYPFPPQTQGGPPPSPQQRLQQQQQYSPAQMGGYQHDPRDPRGSYASQEEQYRWACQHRSMAQFRILCQASRSCRKHHRWEHQEEVIICTCSSSISSISSNSNNNNSSSSYSNNSSSSSNNTIRDRNRCNPRQPRHRLLLMGRTNLHMGLHRLMVRRVAPWEVQ